MAKRKSKTRFYEDDLRAFIFPKKKKTTNVVNPFTGEQIENHAASGAQRAARAKKKAGGGEAKPKPFSLSAMLKEQRAKDPNFGKGDNDDDDPRLRSPKDRMAARTKYQNNYNEIEKDYDAEVRGAIEVYTGDEGFNVVNKHLRGGGDFSTLPGGSHRVADPHSEFPGGTKAVAGPNMQALQDAASAKLSEPVMAYRGVSDRIGDMILNSPNKEYTARGMTSTSMNPVIANSYLAGAKKDAEGVRTGRTMLEIRATKGAPVAKYSQYDDELEIIQAHGARYRVAGVEKKQFPFTGPSKLGRPPNDPVRVIILEQVE